jgi:hypothetical protein
MTDQIARCREILEDLRISISNHKKGLAETDMEYKHYQARADALSQALTIIDEVEACRDANVQKKKKIAYLEAEIERIKSADTKHLCPSVGNWGMGTQVITCPECEHTWTIAALGGGV